jgi:hypothetical protein
MNGKEIFWTEIIDEINFSSLGKYEGLTYVKTGINDAFKTRDDFLSFNIDENAVIFVAYEKLDNKGHSAITEWIKTFKKEVGEIVAQYRYFNVYSKSFVKGNLTLPAADAKINNVGSN